MLKLKLFKLPSQKTLLNNQSGMTLIEILVVLALLGVVLSIVGVSVADRFNRGKVDSAKIQLRQLMTYLDAYRMDCNTYPTTDQGLNALVEKTPDCKNYDPKGYVPGGKMPKDPWGQEFLYTSDGKTFEIKTLGNDRQEGGEGYDKDVTNKDLD